MSDQHADPSPEAKAFEGLGHLQTAATEMIAAVRAFLDVAEGLVKDPRTAAAVATAVQTVTDAAAGVMRPPAPRPADAPDSGESAPDGRVEHIRVE